MLSALVVAFSLVSEVQAPGTQGPDPRTAAASAGEPSGLDAVVCRRQGVTGSRLKGGRVCKTERQWLADKDDARRFGDDVQKRIKIPDKAAGG